MDPNDWTLTGNAGTNPATNFLGTTGNEPLIIKTNNTERLHIDQTGKIGIGTTTPATKVHVIGDIIRIENADKILDIRANGAALDVQALTKSLFLHSSGPSGSNNVVINPFPGQGNVGIGNAGPDSKLHITSGGDFNSPQVHIFQTTLGDFARLRFGGIGGPSDPDQPGNTAPWPSWDIAANIGILNFFVQGPGNIMTLSAAAPRGRVGIGTEDPQAELHVAGAIFADGDIRSMGMKPFVQAHPTDPTKEIVYVALEGGEVSTYNRGTWKLDNGKAVIELPEHFGFVTSEDGLTVQLTPRSEWLQLSVVQVNTKQIIIEEAQGKSGQFDYLIQGVRKGYEHHEAVQERK